MSITISPFTIDTYDQVIALWEQSDGVGLSNADSRENIQFYTIFSYLRKGLTTC